MGSLRQPLTPCRVRGYLSDMVGGCAFGRWVVVRWLREQGVERLTVLGEGTRA